MDVGFVYEQMLHKWTKSLYSLLLFPMLCKSFCRSKKAKQIIKRENFPAIGSTWKKKKKLLAQRTSKKLPVYLQPC